MANDKQEILDAIGEVASDVDAVAIAVDKLEAIVLAGSDSSAAFAEIKSALAALRGKSSALKTDAETTDSTDLPPAVPTEEPVA